MDKEEQPLTEGYYGQRNADGAWHGLGVRTFGDGRQYAGQWQAGAMTGLGRLQGPARADEGSEDEKEEDGDAEEDVPPRTMKGAAAARAAEAKLAAVPAGYCCCGEWVSSRLHGLAELHFARRSGGYVRAVRRCLHRAAAAAA